MLDTLQEIKENGIVNCFKDIAESYGFYGSYINWQPGGLNDGGIYFVCGLDKSKVLSRDIDMHQVLENQRKSNGLISTDITAFRMSGEHPLMLQHDFIEYCHKIDTAQKVYNHLDKTIPPKLSNEMLETLRMTWDNFTNADKSPSLRKEYEKMLVYAVKVEAEGVDKNNSDYKKRQYMTKGYYDTGKGKLYNWFKRHFFKHKNEVSLDHLMAQYSRVSSAKITYRNYNNIKKALQERPELLYSFSEVRGDVLKVVDSEGFGSKENNDKRFYTLYYGSVFSKDIEEMIQKINYPEEFNRTIDEIDSSGCGTEHLVMPVEYYDIFKKRCDEAGIKFCIDKSSHDTIGGGIPIAFSAVDSSKVYNFLTGIIKASENYRLKEPLESHALPTNKHSGSESPMLASQECKTVNPKKFTFDDFFEDR